MPPIAIEAINLANNQITVSFDQNWFQEDIDLLRQLLLDNISNLYVKETVIGADLEHTRFHWLDVEFTVHFEYYSQSCWFSTQDLQCSTEIVSLFNLLQQNHKNYA